MSGVTVTFDGCELQVPPESAPMWQRAVEGSWEPETRAALTAHVGPRSTVVDIGAYIGIVSGLALASGAQVHAYEPDPVALRSLEALRDLNPDLGSRLHVHAFAVGAAAGRFVLRSEALGNSGSSLVRNAGIESVTVEVQDVRSLVMHPPFDACTFMKVDIEGAEYAVVPRMNSYLMRQRPVLLLSTHTYPFRESHSHRTWLSRGVRYRLAALPRQLRLLALLPRLGRVAVEDTGSWREVGPVALLLLGLRVGEKEFLVRPRSR